MRRRRRGSVAPIYAFILIWLLCSLAVPLFKFAGLLLALGVSAGVAMGVAALIKRAAEKRGETSDIPEVQAEPEPEYPPQVAEIIADGRLAMQEMGRLYKSIETPVIRQKINEIMRVSDKIVQDAIQDPSDVPQIRKFLNYYLPTTIKLLNAYDRMSATGIEGENVTKSMQSIEEMLDTTIEAYKKQLDSLFENQAMDIETDITVMNGMMAREGLTGGGELDELISKAAREQIAAEEKKRREEAAKIKAEADAKARLEASEAKAKAEEDAKAALREAQAAAIQAARDFEDKQRKQEFTNAEEAMKQAAQGGYSSFGEAGAAAAQQKEEQ